MGAHPKAEVWEKAWEEGGSLAKEAGWGEEETATGGTATGGKVAGDTAPEGNAAGGHPAWAKYAGA